MTERGRLVLDYVAGLVKQGKAKRSLVEGYATKVRTGYHDEEAATAIEALASKAEDDSSNLPPWCNECGGHYCEHNGAGWPLATEEPPAESTPPERPSKKKRKG